MNLANIKSVLARNKSISLLHAVVKPIDLKYKYQDLNKNYYNKIKNLGDVELEHQIGRLTNFKEIVSLISKNKLMGDFIEFGVWRGFSLLWTAYLAEREALLDRKFIGLDSFKGLPNSEGEFSKGSFRDTSLLICKRNLLSSGELYPFTKKQIHIESFSFQNSKGINRWLNKIKARKFVFVHIDCDLSSSMKDVFYLLRRYDMLSNKCYILFDDYNMETNLAKNVEKTLKEMKKEWKIKIHSSTHITKNYYLERR